MGFYSTTGASRADIIRECTDPWTNEEGVSARTLAHCTVGNTLWAAQEVTKADGTVEKYIACCLLGKRPEGWGYKPMDETMGPYYYTCPLAYLTLVPDPQTGESTAWRHKVLVHHAELAIERAKVARLQLYETWSVVNARNLDSVVIVNLKPLLGHAMDGKRYRLQAKHLGERLQAGPVHAQQTPRVRDTVAQLALC